MNDQATAGENAPYGQANRDALDKLIALGQELGFEVKDYEGYVATLTWGNEGKEIGVLAHMDVVPAGDGWNTDPFEPVIIDGKMFGRGTIDDKGPLLAALYAAKAVMMSGLPVRNYGLFQDGWEGKGLGIACEDQLSGKLTMNLGLMRVDEHAGEVEIDIRCPIHSDMNVHLQSEGEHIAGKWKMLFLMDHFSQRNQTWHIRQMNTSI